MRDKISGTHIRGRIRMHQVEDYPCQPPRFQQVKFVPGTWSPVTGWTRNNILKQWAAIAGTLLASGNSAYRISGMYLEFQNTVSPGDTVVAPSFDREIGSAVAYYNALASSSDTDYLRVPLVAATLTSSDETEFPDGNLLTFFAQTQGVSGVHGKPFSDVHNSTVFGAALVAMVDQADATRDLIFSRAYLDAAEQQSKLASKQIGLEWEQLLG